MAQFMPTETNHAAQNTNRYAYLGDALESYVFLPPAIVVLAFLFAEFSD
jgi:hypothetical protein